MERNGRKVRRKVYGEEDKREGRESRKRGKERMKSTRNLNYNQTEITTDIILFEINYEFRSKGQCYEIFIQNFFDKIMHLGP